MENKTVIDEIMELIDKTIELHPYKRVGNRDSYSSYNEGWEDGLDRLKSEIDVVVGNNNKKKEDFEKKVRDYTNKIVFYPDEVFSDMIAFKKEIWEFFMGEEKTPKK